MIGFVLLSLGVRPTRFHPAFTRLFRALLGLSYWACMSSGERPVVLRGGWGLGFRDEA